jgi:membrane protein
VAQAGQNAMNTIWRVPRNSRPNPFKARLRSLLLLVVVGLSVIGTTIVSGLGATAKAFGVNMGGWSQVLLVVGSLVVNAGIFMLAFKIATAKDLRWRQIVPGAVGAAVAWEVLQLFGAAYVSHVVNHASVTNSVFALVLGLIGWIYLEALAVIFAVEYNAVRSMKLWPRALLTPFTDNVDLTAADKAAYTAQARGERTKGFETISVDFGDRHEKHSDTE